MATHAPSPANAAFFADLVRSETRLYNHFNDELRARHGITTSQYEFLHYIRDHDGARTTDMAAEFAIGVGAVSKAMDRLESRGLVVRLPNPANRRSTIITTTDEGRAVVDAAETTFLHRLGEILADAATPEQLTAAGAVLTALRRSLERAAVGVPAG
ncbi:MarR family winged helix-turn-helix transcriptional regulator [Leifsonia sp. L25]|uniref:MarR family winged helix-turn-helix transcriptional regulator n=1 Tax=Actinomycetes TaxID=1760 RepID=UPI003D697653